MLHSWTVLPTGQIQLAASTTALAAPAEDRSSHQHTLEPGQANGTAQRLIRQDCLDRCADDEALPGDDEDFVAGEGVAEALRVIESGGRLIDTQVTGDATLPLCIRLRISATFSLTRHAQVECSRTSLLLC